ncbi:MAG: TonB-dependent receptor [Chitinophagaceae bacterium]|nr:MAG: TonB-dependent receptor [Chitinophagaceae bacterium]
MRTQKAEPGKTSISQQVLLGNYGLERYTTTFQRGTERASLLLNYGHQESRGAANHNQSRKDFVNFVGDFTPNSKQTVTTYFGFTNSFDQRYGELDTSQWRREDYSGNTNYIKNDAHSRVVSVRAGFGHTYQFNEHFSNSTTLYGYGAITDASSAGGWTDKDPINFGLRSTFNARFNIGEVVLSGISGVESQHQRAQTIGYGMAANPFNPGGYNRISSVTSNLVTRTAANSLFSEWTLGFPDDFSITAGIGWSELKLRLTNRLAGVLAATANANTPNEFTKDYGGMWSPHLAVNKVFNENVSAYASWSRGFKAPVTSYFYIPYVAGAPATGLVNPNLVPERGDQFEIGSKGNLWNNRIGYELAAFRTTFSNKMTTIAVPLNNDPATATTAYSYVANGGRQVHTGVEFAVRATVVKSASGFFREVAPFANFTYIDGKYEDYRFMRFRVAPNNTKDSTVDYSGKQVAGLPPVVFNAGVDVLTAPGIYFNAYYMHRDAVYLTGDNLVRAEGFGLLNAKLGFRRSLGVHFDLDASVGAVNLGGVQYYQMIFINQLPDAYVAAPRNTQWFGGITLKYNF